MSYFHQTHYLTLNEKGRFVFPSMFRNDSPPEVINGDFWITPSTEGYLTARPDPIWKKYIESIHSAQSNALKKREYLRALYGSVLRTKVDNQNRFFLSPQTRQYMGIKESDGRVDIVLIGAGTSFEIWTLKLYEQQRPILSVLSDLKAEIESAISTEVF